MIKFEEKKKAITRMKPIRENKTQEQIDDRPLMTPRIRSPLKKGRKQIKFHTEAKTPLGGSISLSLSLLLTQPDLPQITTYPSQSQLQFPPAITKNILFSTTQATKLSNMKPKNNIYPTHQ